jgi:DnaK suppressor protein
MKKTFFTFPLSVLQSVRDFALQRQKDLEKKIKNLDREDPFHDTERGIFNSDDDDIKEQVDHERVDSIRRELENNLSETRRALDKIKRRKYGFCEKCGKLIDTARLEVNPLALYCLNCEKKRDKKI